MSPAKQSSRKDLCFILSIDGGGIRGIVPAVVLMSLAERLAKKNKTLPLSSYFDIIAGTSTGGIIATGLSAPNPLDPAKPAIDPNGLLKLYKDRGKDIFSRDTFRRIREVFSDPRSIWQERYDAHTLEAELQARLGLARLSAGLTNVLLTAYDIERRKAVFMTNTKLESGDHPDDYYFWQAARATSAAPTYFEPARVQNLTSGQTETLVDGGVFANDPAIAAYVEACKIGYALENVYVVSLGTGYQNRPFWYRDVKNWGPVSWINPTNGAPIISIFMQGQASTAAYQMNALLKGNGKAKERYFRFDAPLSIGNDDLDDASETNVLALQMLGQMIVDDNAGKLDAIAALLSERAKGGASPVSGAPDRVRQS